MKNRLSLKKIYKNAALLTFADLAQKGSTGILALVIAHFFGPAIYGDYAAAVAACGMFMMITGLGYEQEFVRRTGIERSTIPGNLALNLTIVTISAVVAMAALLIFLSTGVYSPDITALAIVIGVASVSARYQLTFRHLCLVREESRFTAIIQGVSTFLMVGTTLVLIYLHRSIKEVAVAQLIIAALVSVTWFLWLPSRVSLWSLSVVRRDVVNFFKGSLPFAVTNLLWVAYFNFDTFLLSILKPSAEVGVYAAVYRLVGLNYVLGYAIANTFTPLLFERQRDPAQFHHATGRLVGTMAIVAVPVASALYFFSRWLVPFVIGPEYGNGIVIAQILSLSVFFRLMNFGLGEILTAGGRQPLRIWLESGMLVLNVLFNCLLIPLFGGRGAACATVIAELSLFTAGLLVWKRIRVPIPSDVPPLEMARPLSADEA